MGAVRALLSLLGEDCEREGLRDTPKVRLVAGARFGSGRRARRPARRPQMRPAPTQPRSARPQRVAKAFQDMLAGYSTPLER